MDKTVKIDKKNLKFCFGGVLILFAALLGLLNVVITQTAVYVMTGTAINWAELIGTVIGSSIALIILLALAVPMLLKIDNFFATIPMALLLLIEFVGFISIILQAINSLNYSNILLLIASILWMLGEMLVLSSMVLHVAKAKNKTMKLLVAGAAAVSLVLAFLLSLTAEALAAVYVIPRLGMDTELGLYIALLATTILKTVFLGAGYALIAFWFANPYKKGCSPEELAAAEAEAAAAEAGEGEPIGETSEDTVTEEAAEEPVAEETAESTAHTEAPTYTGPNYQVYFEKYAMPLWQHILLLLFLGGIWSAIWAYRMTEATNIASGEKRDPITQLLLYIFIPFYSIYWTYVTAQRVDEVAKKAGHHSDLAMICLILMLVIPIAPPVLIQDKINNIANVK